MMTEMKKVKFLGFKSQQLMWACPWCIGADFATDQGEPIPGQIKVEDYLFEDQRCGRCGGKLQIQAIREATE